MLERVGIGGGAVRAGIAGGPEAAFVDATTLGLGGMYGASPTLSSAVFDETVKSATWSLGGCGTAPAASGRRAGPGPGAATEFLAEASGLGAGTGICVLAEFPTGTLAGFPDGSTPTGRLAGSGGGGP